MAPVTYKTHQARLEKFHELTKQSVEDQLEFFLKSFIFALPDWKETVQLAQKFKTYCQHEQDLNPIQASDFLQKYGLERTASTRTQEIKDIDLDLDQRISFLEYCLLHYKAMILSEYFKRHQKAPEYDLSNHGIGLVGVGDKLLEELFEIKLGMDPELEKAIEEFMSKKKAEESLKKELEEKSKQGGVKGLTAKNELEILLRKDMTETNRIELTLNAAKKRSAKDSGAMALKKKKDEEEAIQKQKLAESRARLAQRAALFEQGR